jgi:hypothetical protein
MGIESQNKLVVCRLLEEVVNTGAVARLSDFLGLVRWAPDVRPASPVAKGASPNESPAV